MKYVSTVIVAGFLLLAVVFTMTHQGEIRKENNAFVRDCKARGGMVRLEYNIRRCTK